MLHNEKHKEWEQRIDEFQQSGLNMRRWCRCVMSIEYPEKNHQEFPGFITRIPGKNYEVGVAVCRMSA